MFFSPNSEHLSLPIAIFQITGGKNGLTKIPDQVPKQTWKLNFLICDKGF